MFLLVPGIAQACPKAQFQRSAYAHGTTAISFVPADKIAIKIFTQSERLANKLGVNIGKKRLTSKTASATPTARSRSTTYRRSCAACSRSLPDHDASRNCAAVLLRVQNRPTVDRLGLERATAGELRDELRRGARDDGEPFAYLSEVALALGGRSGTPALLGVFDELDDSHAARAVVFAAAEQDAAADAVRSFLLGLLDDERELVTAEAVDGLSFGATPLDGETVARLSRHASPYVRGALLRYLARMRGQMAIRELMAGLEDGSHIVRQNAVDELEELEVRDAIPALRRLVDDSDRDVRAAVRHALQSLANG